MLAGALDTSRKFGSFVVRNTSRNSVMISDHAIDAGPGSASILVRMITLLKDHDLTLKNIGRWTVGMGPGSFNGIRAGAALVQGICHGTDADWRGLPSSLAMARMARPAVGEEIIILHDGRRDEMIVSPYIAANGRLRAAEKPMVIKINKLATFRGKKIVVLQENYRRLGLHELSLPMVVLDYIDAGEFLHDNSDDWPQSKEELMQSIVPVYVRAAVYAKPRSHN